jgi:hypothetical protein
VTIDDTYVVNPFKDPFWATFEVPGPVLAAALSSILAKKLVSSASRPPLLLSSFSLPPPHSPRFVLSCALHCHVGVFLISVSVSTDFTCLRAIHNEVYQYQYRI